ncbi:hypothetical protein TNCV_12401 [Trichonephila clavipes]|nr:hypothetical protein TNCV_12401 [Trichonephila clavipes]
MDVRQEKGNDVKYASFQEMKCVVPDNVRLAKVDSDEFQELIDSHNQELTNDDHIAMHEEDIEELESLDPVQT